MLNTNETVEKNIVVKTKHFEILGTQFVYLYLLGIITAFCGWSVENLARLVSRGILDSRYHILPFIFEYSLIPFAFKILFDDPNDIKFFGKRLFKNSTRKTKIICNVICVISITSAVFLGELALGNFWDAVFGVKLWDYSKQTLHVTQYAGVLSALGFGVGAYVLFKFVHKPALDLLQRKVPRNVALAICATLGILIVADALLMFAQCIFNGEAPIYWSISFR